MVMPLGEQAPRIPARYRVSAKLGEGGMGVVYDAHDEQRGHRVAIKTLKHASADAVYRLKREFRLLADISHPNLVQLYDLVVGERDVSFSMEVVDGVDFVAHVRPRSAANDELLDTVQLAPRGFDEARLRRALAQIVAALRRLHGAGVVHRDVKPKNTLVTGDGRVVLLDFGLAASRQSLDHASLDGMVGTVAYMAPEQASEGGEPASDWYAVGVMLYEALTGRLPHVGTFFEVLAAKRVELPPPPSALVDGVPPDLEALCLRLLAIEPAARPGGPEIAAALGVVEQDVPAAESTRTSRFTGRARELAVLATGIETVTAGRAALTWVRGPSGIGKSALVTEALARIQARHPDAVVLRGRCYDQELVPFKAIDGLIDALSNLWRRMPDAEAAAILPRSTAALQRLFPVLARVSVVATSARPGELRDPSEVRARAFGALRELLHRLSDRRPVVLFLDDLQWVDADTLHLLVELLRRPDPPRIYLVVSSRSEVATPALEEAISWMDVAVTTLDVGPLPADEARVLVTGMVGEGADVDLVVREAAGSPFFLGELARYLASVGRGATASVSDVVRQRISLLSPSAQRLLALIAVAGEPVRPIELASAAELDVELVARELRALRSEQLVRAPGGRGDERVESYHDRIRAAILDGLDAEARRQHHRALACSLVDAAPARVARHWTCAGDHARAAVHARIAGDRAISTLDFDGAADLYLVALAHGEHTTAERRALAVLTGGALRDSGRCVEAAETFLAAAEGAEPMQRLELLRSAAEQTLIAGRIERGIDILRIVLAEIDEELPSSPRRAVVSFVWNHLRISLGGLRSKPRDPSRIPPRELFRLDCYITLGLSFGMVDAVLGAMYQAKGVVAARRLGEPTRLFRIIALYSVFVMSQGGRSLRRGVELVDECAAIAARTGDPYQEIVVDGLRGIAAYFGGDFGTAIPLLTSAERRLREDAAGANAELGNVRVLLSQAARHAGAYTALRERFDALVRDAERRGDQYLKTTLHRSINIRFLIDDDVAGARAALAGAAWSPPAKGIHLQHFYELRAIAEIALYTGEADHADIAARMAAIVAAPLMRVQTVRAEACWTRARLAIAFGGGDVKSELAALAREKMPVADVWIALGRAALADGDAAVAEYERALALADAQRMEGVAHAARWRLGEAIGGERGAALVAEARAGLVAQEVARPEQLVDVLAPRRR